MTENSDSFENDIFSSDLKTSTQKQEFIDNIYKNYKPNRQQIEKKKKDIFNTFAVNRNSEKLIINIVGKDGLISK